LCAASCYHGGVMRSEQDLVPYAPGRLDGSPVLVLAPHADDEVFGCGATLVQAREAGAEVRVVVLTNGEAQGEPEVRRREALRAAEILGLPEYVFWELADRSLRPRDPALTKRLRDLLLGVRPRVLLVPSPAEVHPDHRALALLVYGLLQTADPGTDLHVALQGTRLAAYEVTPVLRPNLLVDVGGQWEKAVKAAEAYESQLEHRPYAEVMDGMARARSISLPAEVRRAQAFHVVDMRFIRTHSVAEWAAAQGASADLENVEGAAQIDVVVRTRNRPHLLRQALHSIRSQLNAPSRVVVVNDGGKPVGEVCRAALEETTFDLVELETSRGRSAAAQIGLERASASHVVFLDDDDLMYPDHLLVLGRAVAQGLEAPYVDAVQGVWQLGEDGELERITRHRTFGGDFERGLFSLVNYIPLLSVAVPRPLALDVGGFDPEIDLYEDWDLLLRLAQKVPLTRVPGVTCEYRVIAGSGAVTGSNPPGSAGQLEALRAIWSRHGLLEDDRRLAASVMALVAARDTFAERARVSEEELVEVRGTKDGLEAELQRVLAEVHHAKERIVSLQAEVDRLNEILEQIYRSKTWKLHELLERFRNPARSR
jgi:LmbE family N-acetylglucosaminyl deacetylase/glycosyltransferase involved in cell wall biosynthesis